MKLHIRELGNATSYNRANHLEECIKNAKEGPERKFLNPLFVLHYLKESEFNSNVCSNKSKRVTKQRIDSKKTKKKKSKQNATRNS